MNIICSNCGVERSVAQANRRGVTNGTSSDFTGVMCRATGGARHSWMDFTHFNQIAARQTSDDVIYDQPAGLMDVSHDDGALFIRYNGARYIYSIGQFISSAEYNRQANAILELVGIRGRVTGNNN